ncbi:MAG: ABC transporter ATP-binding protein [Pseudomonadota bacterium]
MMNFKQNYQVVIRCHDLKKTYGKGDAMVFALRGVDLDIYQSELLMLVGPSGCGKTTFVSIISALLKANSGEITVLGEDLSQLNDEKKNYFRSHSIGFVFQSFNLLPALTAVENVAIPLLIQGVKRTIALQEATIMLDAVGLGSRIHALSAKLSGGQQQRVAIARALVHKPKIIICDEPTSSLDHESGQQIMELLRSLVKQENKTLVAVTHDNRIFSFADRMAYMDDGRIIKIENTIGKSQ